MHIDELMDYLKEHNGFPEELLGHNGNILMLVPVVIPGWAPGEDTSGPPRKYPAIAVVQGPRHDVSVNCCVYDDFGAFRHISECMVAMGAEVGAFTGISIL